ncbi:YhdH/YhfP family quinone oxidoreductase [Permianibacter sp. IMCC34836]|uniref:YhdH/YhfP family quinone oxidoreductase n=1 Tax=Permianibacter fluminis TaxID=2738515 RepID=UPI0015541025|nr:YhdH/YhfP family quinone oxidoreductase [Permianibacter fluminis]NQD37060.1 YhdH/YhfP family quinone oxidoreductase [Permianibacter fluminis]
MSFLACRVFQDVVQDKKQIHARVIEMNDSELSAGEVLVAVEYSGINYKDALAVTGRGKILRSYPLNAGIDLAGTVLESSSPAVAVGQRVLVNGCGLGEAQDGGLAQRARVPADWIIPLPAGLSAAQAMTLGTAGFTAALCLHRMLENHQSKDKGPIVVTGATGGVGSVAVALFASQGYEVIALSGRPEHHDYLRQLGASEVCTLADLKLGDRPLEAGRFGGIVDNVGGQQLAKLIAHVNLWGNVACVGLADSEQLPTTVFPLILRGVSLLGVSSANCPMPLRKQIWQKLGAEWRIPFERIFTETVALRHVIPACNDLLDRKRLGRTIVDCR